MKTDGSASDQAAPNRSSEWLVVFGTACAIAPIVILFKVPHDPVTNGVSSPAPLVAGFVPMVGVVSFVASGLGRSSLRALLPLLPFALAAACFMTTEIVFAVADNEGGVLEGTTNWYGFVQLAALISLVTQPFLAAIGSGVWLARSHRAARPLAVPE